MEENKEENIVDKVIIVTGSSRGIGAEIVEQLAMQGYKVVLNYNRSEEKAKRIQRELIDKGYIVDIYGADVSKHEQVKEMIDWTIKKYNRIDILINNAGIEQYKLFTEITEEDWNNIINTNLTSVFYVSQEVSKQMIKQKQGCIINISSIWGITGASCEVAYSTTKAAINGMTKALAKELGTSNIQVNCIAPGIIDTEMNQNLTEEDLKNIQEEIPLERIGKPQDIAKCVKWLIEDNYTTGQIISVNGGWYI